MPQTVKARMADLVKQPGVTIYGKNKPEIAANLHKMWPGCSGSVDEIAQLLGRMIQEKQFISVTSKKKSKRGRLVGLRTMGAEERAAMEHRASLKEQALLQKLERKQKSKQKSKRDREYNNFQRQQRQIARAA